MSGFAFASYAGPDGTPFDAVIVDVDEPALAVPMSTLDLPWERGSSIGSLFVDWEERLGAIEARVRTGSLASPLDTHDLRPLAPVRPRQVFQAGGNYRSHVAQLVVAQRHGVLDEESDDEIRAEVERAMDERVRRGAPYVFVAPVSGLCGPEDDIVLPADADEPDWEIELAAVIAHCCWRIGVADARAHIAGYTIANDLTLRDRVFRSDLSSIGTDWLAGKGAPTFLPVGPWLVPASFVDPTDVTLTLRLNGEIMQCESSGDMVFDVDDLVSYASTRARLLPGDLLLTGSPAGNGAHHGRYLRAGDELTGEATGLGVQRNRCVEEAVDAG